MKNKTILITGGTGSLGNALVTYLVGRKVKKIIVYSRNEFHQVEMEKNFPRYHFPIRYFLGDVRDSDRLHRALSGVNIVIHCAALKHVDKCFFDPFEAVLTNVVGAQNLISAAIDCNVEKVIAISSDKSVNPCSIYGATKLCADHIFINANVYSPKSTKFSVVRFGNFWGSSGSFIPLLFKLSKECETEIPLTHVDMTRFFITLQEASQRVCQCLYMMNGGEIFTPKMKAFRILDIVKEICPNSKIKIIGLRPGEKLYEELVSKVHANQTYEIKNWYITYLNEALKYIGKRVCDNFEYNSELATKENVCQMK